MYPLWWINFLCAWFPSIGMKKLMLLLWATSGTRSSPPSASRRLFSLPRSWWTFWSRPFRGHPLSMELRQRLWLLLYFLWPCNWAWPWPWPWPQSWPRLGLFPSLSTFMKWTRPWSSSISFIVWGTPTWIGPRSSSWITAIRRGSRALGSWITSTSSRISGIVATGNHTIGAGWWCSISHSSSTTKFTTRFRYRIRLSTNNIRFSVLGTPVTFRRLLPFFS